MSAVIPLSSAGRPLHGLWRLIPSPMLTEVIAQSGFDFQILDCEHGAYDYGTLLPDMLACERNGSAPLVRVAGLDKVQVQRCLDMGARGIVFPQLTRLAEFVRAGEFMDHAPAGVRGFNPFVRDASYGIAEVPPVSFAQRKWFVPIIETLSAARGISEIVSLPRIDLIYIGVYDLSAQLGCSGDMLAPELTELVDRIIAECRRAGKPVALMALTPDAARTLAGRGVQVLVHGVESHCFKRALRDSLSSAGEHSVAENAGEAGR